MRFYLLLLLSTTLFGQTETPSQDEPANSYFMNLDKEPSSIANGSVNVISGEYCDCQTDLVLAGPEPIRLQRCYSSGFDREGSLSRGWSFDYLESINYHGNDRRHFYKADLSGGSHRKVGFYKEIKKIKGQSIRMPIEYKHLSKSSNTSSGTLSARTNLKNQAVRYHINTNHCDLDLGDGRSYIFYPRKNDSEEFLLDHELSPTDGCLKYSWGRTSWDDRKRLKKIVSCHKGGANFGELLFAYGHKKLVVSSSDGKDVTYEFFRQRYSKEHEGEGYFLNRVTRSGGMTESYLYEEGTQRIIKKSRPGNRFLKNGYYRVGENQNGGKKVKVHSENSLKRGRVAWQKAPVGPDATPITTHRYFYYIDFERKDSKAREQKHGRTEVFDAYGRKTTYRFNDDLRLTHIEKYDENDALYSVERLIWGKGDDWTNLIGRTLSDGKGNVYFGRTFAYDKRGNVVEDTLFGNLTGASEQPLLVEKNGMPTKQGNEFYSKKFAYNEKNLMTLEDDGKKKVYYSYYSGTDLLAKKLIEGRGSILLREFYKYDSFGAVVEEIKDDGCGTLRDDLTGVTERRVKKTVQTSTNPRGFPALVEEYYLDLATQKLVLIEKAKATYNASGLLTSLERYDCQGNFVSKKSWDYDEGGHCIFEVDPMGIETRRTIDVHGNILSEVRGEGNLVKEFQYDFSNRLIKEEEVLSTGEHLVTSHAYDYLGNRVKTVDPFGGVNEKSYDPFCRLIKERRSDGSEILFEYDIFGAVIKRTDPLRNETRARYTLRNQPARIDYPDGTYETSRYDLDGTLLESRSKEGVVIRYTYDALGRMTCKAHFSDEGAPLFSTGCTFEGNRPIAEWDAAANKSELKWNDRGQLIERIEGEKRVVFEYDALGREFKKIAYDTLETALVTVKLYDVLDRVTEERVEDLEGKVFKRMCLVYDQDGNLVEKRDGDKVFITKFSPKGQQVLAIDPEGNETRLHYGFEPGGLVVTMVDPKGIQKVQSHDLMGREVKVEVMLPTGELLQKEETSWDALGNKIKSCHFVLKGAEVQRTFSMEWEYDACSREIVEITGAGDPHQLRNEKVYDHFGRLATQILGDGTSLSYTYDQRGRLTTLLASDGSVHSTWEYDALDHPTIVSDLVAGTKTVRTYDVMGRLIKEEQASGLTICQKFDLLDRLTEVTFADGTSACYGWEGPWLKEVRRGSFCHTYLERDGEGNVLVQEGMGQKIASVYDKMGRLVSTSGGKISEKELCYDERGSLVSRSVVDDLGTSKYTYQVDALGQLIKESGDREHSYNYDSLHNRLEKDGILFEMDALNRPLSFGDGSFEWDKLGRLLSSPDGKSYRYDALGRLIEVKINNATIKYAYDPFHRRVARAVYEGEVLIESERYLYHGDDEVGAFDVAGKALSLRVLGSGKGAEIGAAVLIELSGSVYGPIHDQSGSVVGLVGPSGELVERYRMSAFGEGGEGLFLNPWRFSSKRHDPLTGLVCFGRRDYSPELGRWIEPDPLGFGDGANVYAYVHNSPLVHIDLFGLFSLGNFFTFSFSVVPAQGLIIPLFYIEPAVKFGARGVAFAGDHLVPIPIVNDALSISGRIVSGGDLKAYLDERRENRSKCADLGRPELSDRERLVYFNGMDTSYREALAATSMIASMHGGANVLLGYNGTRGFITDLCEVFIQKFHISTRSEIAAVATLRRAIREVGGVGGGGRVTLYCHSQGGLIGSLALSHLTSEERKMVHVVTFGSAKIISEEGLGSAVNYVSCADKVPFLSDPKGIELARNGCRGYNVQFVGSRCGDYWEHAFMGKTYSEYLWRHGQNYLERNKR